MNIVRSKIKRNKPVRKVNKREAKQRRDKSAEEKFAEKGREKERTLASIETSSSTGFSIGTSFRGR